MARLQDTTLVFLIKRSGGAVVEISLAMKKRSFGMGRWNGVGGKLLEGESVESAARRETKEEIGVQVGRLHKVAELTFFFPHKPEWNQLVHVYFCEEWKGEPTESEEMRPEWFTPSHIPFDTMWPDDIFWLPQVLEGKFVTAQFTFGEGDVIVSQNSITN